MQDSGLSILFMGSNFLRLLQGLWVTLQLSLISVAISLPLGIAFGMFMTLKHPAARIISRLILDFVRIMPQLVLLFILYFGVAHAFGWNLSAYASAVAMLVIWGTAEMGDLVRGALISIPRHQYESAAALGMTDRQTFLEVILPQTVQMLLPPAIYLFTRMIKTTSIVVLIGIVEVLKTGQQIIDANRLQFPSAALWIYGVIFFLYFLVCWPVSLLAKRLERRMN